MEGYLCVKDILFVYCLLIKFILFIGLMYLYVIICIICVLINGNNY